MSAKYILGIHGRASTIDNPKGSWIKRKEDIKKRGWKINNPQFDSSEDPSYESWAKTLDSLDFSKYNAILTTSHGGGVIVKYLLDNDVKIEKLIMVCPGKGHTKIVNTGKLYNFLDKNDINLRNLVKDTIVINSKDDEIVNPRNGKILAKKVGAKFIQLDGYGHKMKAEAIKIVNDLI